MHKCIDDPSRKYKGTEPSPKGLGLCAHTHEEGYIHLGRDQNMWIVDKRNNGSLYWKKYQKNSKPLRGVSPHKNSNISKKKSSIKKSSIKKGSKNSKKKSSSKKRNK